MNVSRRWLEAFLRRPLESADVAHRLAMLGAAVDAIEPVHPGLEEIVIGLVEQVAPHPDADRLQVCTVNAGGSERRQVVCGAKNVTVGHRYPFIPVGATLPGGPRIEKRKLRGVVSEGMLCSARELGLGQDHEGIMELDTTAEPGTSFLEACQLADERLVVDVTPNRPDLLGHKGVARELAVSYGALLRLPDIPGAEPAIPSVQRADGHETVVDGVRVAIDDTDGCRRFLSAVIRNVAVGPSPAWLRDRLLAAGVRSINNVVDATNYVMLELNQPMHAYDIARLEGPAVIARRATAKEPLVTLDDVARTLSDDMTVIADARGAIGVAGVMGAAHVEVTADTTDVFLECAWFEQRRVRRTRRTLGLSTEASYRFERGVDLWNGPEAIRRCVAIILATAGGTLSGPPVDLWPRVTHPPRIFLRPARVAQVLGVELPWAELERTLTAIGATVLAKPDDERIAVDVPGYRPDLVAEIDLIEEVARIHGYDNFPTELRPYRPGRLQDDPAELAVARVRDGLVAQGLYEVQTLPMVPEEGGEQVRLLNPLSAEEGFLRRELLPSLGRQVELNWSNHVRDVRLFEIGTVFEPGDGAGAPVETLRVAAVITGRRSPVHWADGGHGPDVDLWDLRGLLEAAVALAVPGGSVQVEGDSWVVRTPDGRPAGRAMRLVFAGPPWAAPVFGLELSIDPVLRAPVQVAPLPGTPAAERDLALLLPDGVQAAAVVELLRRSGGAILESIAIFDEYRGGDLAPGTRSVGFRLTFRAPDRTLREAEITAARTRLLKALEKELGVQLRET